MQNKDVRIISLSGMSGIAVGICGLIGSFAAYQVVSANYSIQEKYIKEIISSYSHYTETIHEYMGEKLMLIAILTFSCALFSAFMITVSKSKKDKMPIWNWEVSNQITRLGFIVAVCIVVLLKLIESAYYGLIVPMSIIFYGLALVIVSTYASNKVKLLGIFQIILGLASLWMPQWGIYFAATAFGFFHLIYGGITFLKSTQIKIAPLKSDGKW